MSDRSVFPQPDTFDIVLKKRCIRHWSFFPKSLDISHPSCNHIRRVREGAHNRTPAGVIENRLINCRIPNHLSRECPGACRAVEVQKFHLFSPFYTYLHIILIFFVNMFVKRQPSGLSPFPVLSLKPPTKPGKIYRVLSGFSGLLGEKNL